MVSEALATTKRPDYPSGRWSPDPEFSRGGTHKFWYLSQAILDYGEPTDSYSMIFWLFDRLYWLFNGHPVEGLVTSVTDNLMEHAYKIYFEKDTRPYVVQYSPHPKIGPVRLHIGRPVTLILGRSLGIAPPAIVIPPTAEFSSGGAPRPTEFA